MKIFAQFKIVLILSTFTYWLQSQFRKLFRRSFVMNPVTFLVLLCFTCCSCSKKSNPSPLVGVQVQVSGLTDKTALNIKITDANQQGQAILNLSNSFGNTTYTTSSVSPGDQLTITYSTNIPDDLAGDGDGTIKFFYRGEQMGAVGGILKGTTHDTVPTP